MLLLSEEDVGSACHSNPGNRNVSAALIQQQLGLRPARRNAHMICSPCRMRAQRAQCAQVYCARVCVCMLRLGAWVRACARARVRACVRACERGCVRVCMHACMYACAHVCGCVGVWVSSRCTAILLLLTFALLPWQDASQSGLCAVPSCRGKSKGKRGRHQRTRVTPTTRGQSPGHTTDKFFPETQADFAMLPVGVGKSLGLVCPACLQRMRKYDAKHATPGKEE